MQARLDAASDAAQSARQKHGDSENEIDRLRQQINDDTERFDLQLIEARGVREELEHKLADAAGANRATNDLVEAERT